MGKLEKHTNALGDSKRNAGTGTASSEITQYWVLLPPMVNTQLKCDVMLAQMTLCLLVDKDAFLQSHDNHSVQSVSANDQHDVQWIKDADFFEVENYIQNAIEQVGTLSEYNPLAFSSGELEQIRLHTLKFESNTEKHMLPKSQVMKTQQTVNNDPKKASALFNKPSHTNSTGAPEYNNTSTKMSSSTPSSASKPKPLLLQVHLQQQANKRENEPSKSKPKPKSPFTGKKRKGAKAKNPTNLSYAQDLSNKKAMDKPEKTSYKKYSYAEQLHFIDSIDIQSSSDDEA